MFLPVGSNPELCSLPGVGRIGNQIQTYLNLAAALQPHWRHDPALATRVQSLLAKDRRYGSKDRKLYRELLYTTLRYLPWVESLLTTDPDRAAATVAWLASDLPAVSAYRTALTAGWPACPPLLAGKAAHLGHDPLELLPAWVKDECPAALAPAEIDTLHRRASLWLRCQVANLDEITAEFDRLGWNWQRPPLELPALELAGDVDVTQTEAYRSGAVEIQDLGSQLLLRLAGITPGERWLDACAGAGGKSLQLAGLLGPHGSVTAHDIRPRVLDELQRRAQRAQIHTISIARQLPSGPYDGVLVDAPCSGSGTWRRAPHLKWCTPAATIASSARRQAALLDRFARLVRPGGRLVYATCSLCQSENEAVAAGFIERHPDFAVEPPVGDFGYPTGPLGTSLLPARHNTDGFFVSSLRRR